MSLKKLTEKDIQIIEKVDKSPSLYQVGGGSELTAYRIPSKADLTFKTDPNVHWLSTIGLYTQSQVNLYGIDFKDGGFGNTSVSDIEYAYNTGGFLAIDFSSTVFRQSITKNLSMTLPITGGTGELSGLTSITVYTGMLKSTNSLETIGAGVCSLVRADEALSEENKFMNDIGIGDKLVPGVNPSNGPEIVDQMYQSGYMFFWSDTLDFSGATSGDTGGGWSGTSKYTKGSAPLKNLTGPNMNQALGVMNLNSGLALFWNQDIVTYFNTLAATGGTSTSGLTFNTSDMSAIMGDLDKETYAEISVMLGPNTFGLKGSSNPSLTEAAIDGVCGDALFTSICFYDSSQVLMATGTFSTPVSKPKDGYVTAIAKVAVSESVRISPSEDGRNKYYY